MKHLKKYEGSEFRNTANDIIDILAEVKDNYPSIDGIINNLEDDSIEIVLDIDDAMFGDDRHSIEFVKNKNKFIDLIINTCERLETAIGRKIKVMGLFSSVVYEYKIKIFILK